MKENETMMLAKLSEIVGKSTNDILNLSSLTRWEKYKRVVEQRWWVLYVSPLTGNGQHVMRLRKTESVPHEV